MKIAMFNYRQNVEGNAPIHFSLKYGVKIELFEEPLTKDNYLKTTGFEAISIVGGSKLDRELLGLLKKNGVRFINTRSIGYDHIDTDAADSLGIRISNNTYSVSSVADFAITLMLMTTRKVKTMLDKAASQHYDMNGVKGVELHNLTVGVIGTGKIGQTVIKRLSGFDSKILAYDIYQNDFTKQYASYVDLDTLLKESDIISLHIPATKETRHMINKETISKMKDGVIIINTARGDLIDSRDLLEALLSGKVGSAGLDVLEGEEQFFKLPDPYNVVNNQMYYTYRNLPNVILTPHKAFFTDQATDDMVENSIVILKDMMEGKESSFEI